MKLVDAKCPMFRKALARVMAKHKLKYVCSDDLTIDTPEDPEDFERAWEEFYKEFLIPMSLNEDKQYQYNIRFYDPGIVKKNRR